MTGPTSSGPVARLVALLRRRELAFLAVGGVNTALGLVAFAVIYSTLGARLHYLGSLVLAYAVALGVAFFLHRRFVFHVQGNVLVDLVRFISVQAVAFAMNATLLFLFVEGLRAPVLPAQVVALGLTVAASYFGHLLISFRRPEPARAGSESPTDVRDDGVPGSASPGSGTSA